MTRRWPWSEKYDDRHAVTRGLALAGSHSQVEMRHLNLTAEEVNDILRLASRLRFADRRLRSIEDVAANRQPLSGLWKHGISGDLPILLVRAADDSRDSAGPPGADGPRILPLQGLHFDLVVLSEHAEGYRKDFYDQLGRTRREQRGRRLARQAGRHLHPPCRSR